ncbi:Thioredoxin-like fold [Syntrophomonas zehnderi OL-4]|uniref:Thioredoxin-like fold n=1 Tax=Syntrophomonas zehnderi OL-4 TaxID=690567 RepID=A0A0E4GB07_9FIRM|nr:hypothetical protein [Syntrophomonas zehnderi]CFX74783.1 Thioredoxin-like fold [Syntrophomonas zehnderi OL-4]
MKRSILYLTLLVMVLGAAGCGSTKQDHEVRSFNDLSAVPAFTCQDLNGNEVNNDIFQDNKLTLINIWATT